MLSAPLKTPQVITLAARLLKILAALYFVLLACVIAYIWVVAQDRFLSVASFKISRQSPSSGESSIAQLALPGLSDTGSVDSQIAIGFVNSTDLLFELERKFNLVQHYSAPPEDFIFRLEAGDPLEKRLNFYRKRIFCHFDKETGMTMLTVDTFNPQLSKEIAEEVLRRTEAFINMISQSVADHQLVFVRGEMERAEKQVRDATHQILALQNKHNLVSPDDAISANLSALRGLRMERMDLEKSLATLERDSPDSPRIDKLRSQLRSLDELIAVESTKISGPEQDRLNQVLMEFKELDLNLNFALQMRASAKALLEKHRIEVAGQSRYVSIIQKPYLPEEVGYPKRSYASVTILVLGILMFVVLRVMCLAIAEKI